MNHLLINPYKESGHEKVFLVFKTHELHKVGLEEMYISSMYVHWYEYVHV